MKIQMLKYDYVKDENDKLTRVEIDQPDWICFFKWLLLICFKAINHKHIYNKDEYGRYVIQEILDIRGIRTCAYEGIGGQVVIAQFMWKIGKIYI